MVGKTRLLLCVVHTKSRTRGRLRNSQWLSQDALTWLFVVGGSDHMEAAGT